jgi:hypothetical protein
MSNVTRSLLDNLLRNFYPEKIATNNCINADYDYQTISFVLSRKWPQLQEQT